MVVVVALVGVGVLGGRGVTPPPSSSDPPESAPALGDGPPVVVSSDAPRHPSLDALVAASDLVLQAEVEATAPGRTFGEPGGGAIVSRLVTLRIDEVLVGGAPLGDPPTLVVEEEGWLEDGRPLAVDGLAPSEVGDQGFWFLVRVGDPEMPVHMVVNAGGRYLVAGATLVGADNDDPLIARIESLTPDALRSQIAALAP